MLLVTLLYFGVFLGGPLLIGPATLGQAGDYFGGLLNPALSFLSVFALLVTLVLQNRELRLSREALKVSQTELELSRKAQVDSASALAEQNRAIQRQSFEQTFFAWLGTYQTLLGEISCRASAPYGVTDAPIHWLRGRPALKELWNRRLTALQVCSQICSLTDNETWREAYRVATGEDAGLYASWSDDQSTVEAFKREAPSADTDAIFAFYAARPGGDSLVNLRVSDIESHGLLLKFSRGAPGAACHRSNQSRIFSR